MQTFMRGHMRLRGSQTSIGIEALSSSSICLEEAANGGAF